MGDARLFRLNERAVAEIKSSSMAVEKSLQNLIEANLEVFLGVRFLATEYSTGKSHTGRLDTLGIDENGSPVIIEYKRASNENVINQGLFYLNWLMDHRGEFELLVMKRLGGNVGESIDWTAPRLLCIAGEFSRYDEHATKEINRNIELIRYRRYGHDLLLLDSINTNTIVILSTEASKPESIESSASLKKPNVRTIDDRLGQSPPDVRDRFESLKAYLMALGDDVQLKPTKHYFAFRRLKNFACVEVSPQQKSISIFLKLNPDSLTLVPGFMRDVRTIGHYGTGDLEITIKTDAELELAKPLIDESYESS